MELSSIIALFNLQEFQAYGLWKKRKNERRDDERISNFVVQTSLPSILLQAYISWERQQERTIEIPELSMKGQLCFSSQLLQTQGMIMSLSWVIYALKYSYFSYRMTTVQSQICHLLLNQKKKKRKECSVLIPEVN